MFPMLPRAVVITLCFMHLACAANSAIGRSEEWLAKGMDLKYRNPAEAMACFVKAVEQDDGNIDALREAGLTAAQMLYEYDRAMVYLDKAEEIGKAGPARDYADILRAKSIVCRRMGKLDLSEKLSLESKRILERNKLASTDTYADMLMNHALIHLEKGENDLALAASLRAKELKEKIGVSDSYRYALLLSNIGVVHMAYGKDKYGLAGKSFREARKTFKALRLDKTIGYAMVMSNMGILRGKKAGGGVGTCYKSFSEARRVRDELGLSETHDYAMMMLDWGISDMNNGRGSLVLNELLVAERVWNALGKRDMVRYGDLMGLIAFEHTCRGKLELGGEYYRSAYEAYERSGQDSRHKAPARARAEAQGAYGINGCVSALASTDSEIRRVAVATLKKKRRISSAFIAMMLDQIEEGLAEDGDVFLATGAVQVLASFGSEPIIEQVKSRDCDDYRVDEQIALLISGYDIGAKISAARMLVRLLSGSDRCARINAMRAIRCIGICAADSTVDALSTMLDDPERGVRVAAAEALEAMENCADAAIPEMVRALRRDSGSKVRLICAKALGNVYPTKSAINVLGEAAKKDDNSEVRAAAAGSLEMLSKIPAIKTNKIDAGFDSKSRKEKFKIVSALGLMNPGKKGVVPALLKVYKNEEVKYKVMLHLSTACHAGVPLLNGKEKRGWMLENAFSVMQDIYRHRPDAFVDMSDALGTMSADTRLLMAELFAKTERTVHKRGYALLSYAAKHHDPAVRKKCVKHLLWQIGRYSQCVKLTAALLSFGGDDDPAIRLSVAEGISRMAAKREEVIPLYELALVDGERTPALCAAYALFYLGPAGLASLIKGMDSRDSYIRGSVIRLLRRYNPHTPAIGEAIVIRLKDDDVGVRKAAAEALGEIGIRACATVPYLAWAWHRDEKIFMKKYCRQAIANFGDTALDHLIDGLTDGDVETRIAVAEYLGTMGNEAQGAAKALRKASEGDKDPSVRSAASRTLEMIGQ